jgi:hypothetical protein
MDNAVAERIRVEIDQELIPVVPEYLQFRLLDSAEIERLLASGGKHRALAT